MKPWITLATAAAPDGSPLVLQQRGEEFVIRARGQVLMGSRAHGSEEAMAAAVGPGARRVLVGGLGLGYTLRAVLDRVGPGAKVRVAELVPAVVAWNRGPLAHLARSPLEDPRVEVFEGDVLDAARERGGFDAILLDVDNGPSALTQPRNAALYAERGIRSFARALAPRGALVTWSASQDAAYASRLERLGFAVEVQRGGGSHVLFVARRLPAGR